MPLEHTPRDAQRAGQSGRRTYTIITPAVLSAALTARSGAEPTPQVDETRQLMVQGLRLLAGAWDDAAPPLQALRCMESLGLYATSLDEPEGSPPYDGGQRLARETRGDYDIALALRTPPTLTTLLQRVRLARQALRPAGTLALAATVSAPGDEGHEASAGGPRLVGGESEPTISLPTLREILATEGFSARVIAWQTATTLAKLALVGRALPAPRRLLVIASLGDGTETRRLRLRSA